MRRLVIALLAVPSLAVAIAGCGAEEQRKPAERVRLTIDGPDDGAVVREEVVRVHGTVRPRRAEVEVAGRRAEVVDGAFSVEVPVRDGANVLDLAATASEARPALAGLRVVRDQRVEVPDLAETAPDEAQESLNELGLEARLRDGGGFLDSLVPSARRVCETSPRAGARVPPGTTVTLVVARSC